jgi:hypothetical protein
MTATARPVTELVRIVEEPGGESLYRGNVRLTPAYADIESFDVSTDRQEVVFSARRDAGYDIALAAMDGSEVKWLPDDPADEVLPRWASVGNKTAYVVRNRSGDVIRTVHIPTAFQVIVDFPLGAVRTYEWDAAGERLSVVWETADAAPRTESVRYAGEDRRIVTSPSEALAVQATPFAGGLLLRPASSRYNEKLPLVVWRTDGRLNEWNPARAAILEDHRVAILVIDSELDREALSKVPWIDRLFSVGTIIPGAIAIRPDESVPQGFYRREGDGIAVNPGSVESAAVGFLREQLTGGDRAVR